MYSQGRHSFVSLKTRSPRRIRRAAATGSRASSSCSPSAPGAPATARPRTSAAETPARAAGSQEPASTFQQCQKCCSHMGAMRAGCTEDNFSPEHIARWRRRSGRGIWTGTALAARGLPSGPARRCRAAAELPIGLVTAQVAVGTCKSSERKC